MFETAGAAARRAASSLGLTLLPTVRFRKTPPLSHFYLQKLFLYPDRLGTKMGNNVEGIKRGMFFAFFSQRFSQRQATKISSAAALTLGGSPDTPMARLVP